MRRNATFGFTLIELMIAVAVVGILAALAYPTYVDQVRKSRRSDAQATLLRTAQVLERCYTEYNAYNNTNCVAVDNGDATNLAADFTVTEGGHYAVSANNTLAATSFILTAAPRGDQASDDCGNLTYTNVGIKGVSGDADGNGTGGEADDVELCW